MSNNTHKRSHQNIDQAKLSRLLVNSVLFIITLLVATFVIKTGNRLYMIGMIAAPFAIMLSSRLDVAYVGMLLLGSSMINLPGRANIPISWVFLLIMVGVFFLNFFMQRSLSNIGKKVGGAKPLKAFAVVIIVLMVVRGAGIRALGSSTWGGTPYIILLSSIAFYILAVPGIRIKKKQIKLVVWGGLVLGTIGAYLRHRGVGEGVNELAVTESRAIWLRPFIMGVLPVVFALVTPRRWMISVLLFLTCIALIMMTGFRSRFVMLIALAFGFGFFKSQNKAGYVVKVVALGLCMWVMVVLISPSLPPAMQRAVSFVPGATVDFRVAEDAAGSIEWRMEIWGYAWSELSRYWLIGRGVAFDVMAAVEALGIEVGLGGPFQAFQTHTYHSGPITLIIDFGIPGALIFTAFMIFAFKSVWKIATQVAKKPTFENQYLLFLCVYLLWLIFAFWFVFGDVGGLSTIIMLMAQIFILNQSMNPDIPEAELLTSGPVDGE
jgi:hypothetical protein